jgi:agmatine deiminase
MNDTTVLPLTPTPSELGYRMPAEWARHRATWVAWPHNPEDWPGKFGPIPWVYVEIVRHLARSETVCIVAQGDAERQAKELLARAGVDSARLEFHGFATDRGWLRDSGAIVLVDREGKRAALDWRFNAWAKYENWRQDDELAGQMAAHLGLDRWQPQLWGRRVVLEGGSIDVNGAGLLLTTEECLLGDVQARNPELTRTEIEHALCHYLGVQKVLWLGRGIAGDDTHGHIDDLARFVGPGTVVAVVQDDPGDVDHEPLRENQELLKGMTDLDGRPLEVVTLPMPAPLYLDGQRLPASYANFYVANDRVLVPTFNDARDREALATLAGVFPGREVVGIHAVDLVWGFGTLHCLTQQEPAGRP